MNNKKEVTVKVPILDLQFMSDEEWNRLAYRNWIERNKAII